MKCCQKAYFLLVLAGVLAVFSSNANGPEFRNNLLIYWEPMILSLLLTIVISLAILTVVLGFLSLLIYLVFQA